MYGYTAESKRKCLAFCATKEHAVYMCDKFKEKGYNAAVIDMFTLKPIDKDLIIKYAEKTGKIVTCENHSIHNGLGSAVANAPAANYPAKLRSRGVTKR